MLELLQSVRFEPISKLCQALQDQIQSTANR